MLREIDNYFLQQEEPIKSYLQALRGFILHFDKNVNEAWKYRMPFYCYNTRMFCYIWIHKKLKQPYIGIVEGKKINHPQLVIEKRARMKILLLDPEKDIPVRTITKILNDVIKLYR
ncbi:MAG TPA: DUF1801 domain-containing protein [Cyclobacteriaceae bacterium]|nr:DUF1801 domain-containing protein [Cyclobacteriaceae bacterium]